MDLFFFQLIATNLTTIGYTFGRADVPQRLINQSISQEILLLQKFNDIGGKVLKPKKISIQPQKNRTRPFFIFCFFELGLRARNFSFEKKSFHSHHKNVN